MKMHISEIEFSRNDLKENIQIPSELDVKLAYLIGVQIGDGYLKKLSRKGAVDYCIAYDGHQVNEFEFYAVILNPLVKNLFNKTAKISFGNGTVRINFRSKAIFQFLNRVCGILQSPKTNIDIPDIIKNSNVFLKRAFLRGLADTDFSLTFKKRAKTDYYPVIFHQTSSKSLQQDLIELLRELEFRTNHGFRKSRRYQKFHDSYYIQISGREQLTKWMTEVNFSSTNHLSRYALWKKLRYLPVGTSIEDRRLLLENKNALGQNVVE